MYNCDDQPLIHYADLSVLFKSQWVTAISWNIPQPNVPRVCTNPRLQTAALVLWELITTNKDKPNVLKSVHPVLRPYQEQNLPRSAKVSFNTDWRSNVVHRGHDSFGHRQESRSARKVEKWASFENSDYSIFACSETMLKVIPLK